MGGVEIISAWLVLPCLCHSSKLIPKCWTLNRSPPAATMAQSETSHALFTLFSHLQLQAVIGGFDRGDVFPHVPQLGIQNHQVLI